MLDKSDSPRCVLCAASGQRHAARELYRACGDPANWELRNDDLLMRCDPAGALQNVEGRQEMVEREVLDSYQDQPPVRRC